MIPQRGPRPDFKTGQVVILEMNDGGNSYVAFASAPEENEFEFLELKNPVALICGSQEMIEQTRSRLLNLGLAPEKILTNY